MNWYALKVFFNKVFEMEDRLAGMGLETYLAVEMVPLKGEEHLSAARKLAQIPEGGRADSRLVREGPVIYRRVPMVKSLLFVRADENEILQVSEMLKGPENLNKPEGFVYRTPDWQAFCGRFGNAGTRIRRRRNAFCGNLKAGRQKKMRSRHWQR